jgi:hypothetical protein
VSQRPRSPSVTDSDSTIEPFACQPADWHVRAKSERPPRAYRRPS